MTRFFTLLLPVLLLATSGRSGEGSASGHRSAILGSVHQEFLRVQPCGVAAGPSRYLVDHLALEEEWACIAGSGRYQDHPAPFAVEFIALLKWHCGSWKVVSLSFDPDHATRQSFVGNRRVPFGILPRSIRWSR